jgi:hypothetical protein
LFRRATGQSFSQRQPDHTFDAKNRLSEMVADEFKGWRPDPFGLHELRYFAMDGRPTRLVRDGDVLSHDPPRGHALFTDTSHVSKSTELSPTLLPTSAESEVNDVSDAGGPDEPPHEEREPLATADSPLDGWHPDPFGMHEERYFNRGEPTRLIRDSGIEPYDDDDDTAVDKPDVTATPSAGAGEADVPEADVPEAAEPPETPDADVSPEAAAEAPDVAQSPDIAEAPEATEPSEAAVSPEAAVAPEIAGPPAPAVRFDAVVPVDPAESWRADPFGRHEYRYFQNGRPTAYVTDSDTGLQEDPPAPSVSNEVTAAPDPEKARKKPKKERVRRSVPARCIERVRGILPHRRRQQTNSGSPLVEPAAPEEQAETVETAEIARVAAAPAAPDDDGVVFGPPTPVDAAEVSAPWPGTTSGFSPEMSRSSEN